MIIIPLVLSVNKFKGFVLTTNILILVIEQVQATVCGVSWLVVVVAAWWYPSV